MYYTCSAKQKKTFVFFCIVGQQPSNKELQNENKEIVLKYPTPFSLSDFSISLFTENVV